MYINNIDGMHLNV